MSSNYEEIQKLLKASRTMLTSDKTLSESKNIGQKYGIILEQGDNSFDEPNNVLDKDNPFDSIEKNIKDDEYETAKSKDGDEKIKKDKRKGYRISGGLLYIHGKTTKDLQLTTDDKMAFQESMDEFINDVAEIVDFNKFRISVCFVFPFSR